MPRRWKARGEDAARAIAYTWLIVSGIGVLAFPLQSYTDMGTQILSLGWGVLQLTAVIALAGVVFQKPLWEWRVLVFMGLGVAAYAGISWIAVITQAPSHMGRAGDITFIVFILIARFFAMWQKVEDAQDYETLLRSRHEGDDQ